MSKQKKKVLFVSEASYLNSGYAKYYHEIMTRLHNTGKYVIAELAGYGTMNDPRVKKIPWIYYANNIESTDPKEVKEFYKSKQAHEFGEWRFDKTLLNFRPDIVCSIRDPWMDSFIEHSHLRPYYSTLIMPTADSLYLQPDWLNIYSRADGCLTYTEWSKKVLDKEGGGSINTLGAAPHCINDDIFFPAYNKREFKEKYGLDADSIIIGTVMRNQKRKLFPDLIQSFANAIDKLPEDIAKRTYLYLHTSYPDKQCWDLPRLINEAKIGARVLVSYICRFCKRSSSMIFQDGRTRCPHCNNVGAIMPCVGMGYNDEQLGDVYRLFDLYVQYSVSEGFGIPQIEALGCSVPLVTVDFSAMQDIADRVGAYKIPIDKYYREFESHMLRAYPNNDELTKLLVKFCQLPSAYRFKKGVNMREKARSYFNWDRVGKVWEDALDKLRSPKKTWNAPPVINDTNTNISPNSSNFDVVKFAFNHLYYMPELTYNISGMNLLRDLNFGATVTAAGMEGLDRKKVIERLKGKADGRNLAEQARCGLINLTEEPFIKFAKNRNIKNG